jgi:hypothetical protein
MPPIDPATTERGRKLAFGCVAAFTLPFFVAGASVLWMGIRSLRNGAPLVAWMTPTIIGAVFISIAALVFSMTFFGLRTTAAGIELRMRNPDKPWMWRKDWADGAVVSNSNALSYAMLVFALIWNAISIPAFVVVIERRLYRTSPIVLVVALFPLIGVLLFVSAAYKVLRAHKYGQSRVMLNHIPIPIGTRFTGEIVTRLKERPANGFVVALACVRRVTTGSGRNNTTTESVVWRDELRVNSASAIPTNDGLRIPFAFTPPDEAEPSDERVISNRVIWRLDVSAEVPGIDFADSFELPVFQVGEARHEAEVRRFAPSESDAAAWRPAAESKIRIENTREGGEEIHIDTRPKLRETIPAFLFLFVWFGALGLVTSAGAPIVFPILFAIIGLFVMLVVIDSAIGRSVIRTDPTGITVKRIWFGPGSSSTIPAAQIESVVAIPTSNSPYYEVDVIRLGGMKVRVAGSIHDRHDAEMLAARIARGVAIASR